MTSTQKILTVVLGLLFILSLIALNHLTHRVDAAISYINELESQYPDYMDTVSGGDAYSEWYNY